MARAGVALVLANVRYWPMIAPLVRRQLYRWEQRAQAIPDASLRALAFEKLHEERFNAEVAATLATLAPRAHREHTVEAIVALEVMYDYLDGLTEQPVSDPLRNGHQLFRAFTDAMTPHAPPSRDYYRYDPRAEDGGYLAELASVVRGALARLPAASAIADAALASATRCGEAQVLVHAASSTGTARLERWATQQASGTPLEWREFLAGAVASVLAVHALIAAAADRRTTPEQATAIDAAYLSISALSTMLDSLIDYERDLSTGNPWHLRQYEDPGLMVRPLTEVARRAATAARGLPHASHHIMTLVGVVAYYTSAPTARSGHAVRLVSAIHKELEPLITPTFAVMRAWRLAKRLHARRLGRHAGHEGPV